MNGRQTRWLPGPSGPHLPAPALPATPLDTSVVWTPEPKQDGPPLAEYLAVLRQRWRVVASFAIAGVVVAALGCILTRPLYTATAVLHVENVPPQVTTNIQQVVMPPTYLEGWEFFQDQVQMLESRTLAASVIRDLGLMDDERFTQRNEKPSLLATLEGRLSGLWKLLRANLTRLGGHQESVRRRARERAEPSEPDVPGGLVGRYMTWLEATPVTNTRMIRLSFTTPYPDLSEELATAHARQYIQRNLQTKFQLTGEARKFLEAEIQRVESELGKAEAALNTFRRESNVVSLSDHENAIVERLTDLSRRVTEAEAHRISAEAEHRLVKQREYDSLPAVIVNPLVQSLKTEVNRLELRYAEQSQFFLPTSPLLQETTSQLTQARKRLDREIGQVVAGIESTYLAAQAREEGLRAELTQQQETVLDLKEASGQYIKLEQGVIANRNLYGALLTRLKETDVVKGAQLSNASIIDPAELPSGPSHPRVPLALAFGLTAGLGFGVAVVFVLEHLDTAVRTPEDVRSALNLPTLGVVPSFERPARRQVPSEIALPAPGGFRRTALPNGEVVTLLKRESMAAEAYRGIRTSLLFCNPGEQPRIVLFTSSQAGEGKTATSVNLAISLAQLGKRVIVVDADLRQPRCHMALGIPLRSGLTDVLRGQATLTDVVQRINLKNGEVTSAAASGPAASAGALDLLPGGLPAADPATLLDSSRMRETLQSLSDTYDMVVIDSPPIFPITDAAILATMVDGVVFVVRGQRTERQVTREALERLRFMNAPVIGVVLNGVDPTSTAYNRYSYYFSPRDHVA